MTRWICAFAAALVFASFAGSGSVVDAGTTGSLVGAVDDAHGGSVGFARVTILSPAQNEKTTTDARGAFSFASLAPDTYELTVQKDGFEQLVVHDVRITADQTRTVTAVVRQTLRQIGRVSARTRAEPRSRRRSSWARSNS